MKRPTACRDFEWECEGRRRAALNLPTKEMRCWSIRQGCIISLVLQAAAGGRRGPAGRFIGARTTQTTLPASSLPGKNARALESGNTRKRLWNRIVSSHPASWGVPSSYSGPCEKGRAPER